MLTHTYIISSTISTSPRQTFMGRSALKTFPTDSEYYTDTFNNKKTPHWNDYKVRQRWYRQIIF